jgi:succinoglycan biosynthesis protein ExoM
MAGQVELVSVIVPTFNRPEALQRALNSVSAQIVPEDVTIEVVVVDNSIDGSALWVAERFPAMRYISEPIPGVANARNAGVKAAKGRWVAFIDDDNEAPPEWLANHVQILRQSAQASFGPVEGRSEGNSDGAIPSLIGAFERKLDLPSGSDVTEKAAYLGTGNSVFDRLACLDVVAPFDTSLNETGGEDSLLLQQLVRRGYSFVWAASAPVIEWIPTNRLNWNYVTRRRFVSGQIRTMVQYKLKPVQWDRILFWMVVGLVQGSLWTVAAWFDRDRTRALQAQSKASGGWGKLFWAERFRTKLYGTRLVS